jgi:hypothetical protein
VIAGGPFALVVAGFGAISLAIAGIAKFSKEASDNMTGIGMAFGLSGKKARDFADDYDNLKDVISRRNESVMLSERDPASRDVHKKNTGEFNNQIEKMIQKMSDGVPADKLPKFWSEMYGQTGVTPPPQIQKVIDNWNKYRLNQTPAMPEVATQEKRPEAAAAVADVKVKEPVVKEIPRSIPEARKPDLSKSEESFKKALDQSEIVDQLASVNSNLLTLISKMGGGKTSPAKLNATVTVESGLAAFAGGTIPR